MKIKRNIAIGLGVIMIAGISIAGVSNISADAANKTVSTTSTKQETSITESEARNIMTGKVPGAEIIEFKLEKDDGILKYDGTLIKDNMEYDIDVDAKTGKIISFEEEVYDDEDRAEDQVINNNQDKNISDKETTETKDNTNYISREEAKKIMKNKASGATLVDFEFDMDDGRAEYEGELVKNNVEYDIVVDAVTGEIVEFETDYDDDDRYDDDRYDYDDDDDDDDDRYDDDEDDDDDED